MASSERADLPVIFETPIQFPLIPDEWSYETSIDYIRPKLNNWKNDTIEIATELYIAQEILSNPGRRTDLVPRETRLPTFEEYCKEIGVAKSTAYRWIKSVFGVQLITTEQQEPSLAVGGHEPLCPHCGNHTFQSTCVYLGDSQLNIKDIYCCKCGVKIDITDEMIQFIEASTLVVHWADNNNKN